MEQNKVTSLHRELLRNAAVDGDCCLYTYFDPDVETGQAAKGAIRCESIENINVHFGNPYTPDVQSQPFIIIAQRKTIKEAKDEAKRSGSTEWDSITEDSDSNQMEEGDSGLCTVLIKLWKETNDEGKATVRAYKCTEKVEVQPETDTEYTLYPIAWMPWEKIKASCHGMAECTGLIANQIAIKPSVRYDDKERRTHGVPEGSIRWFQNQELDKPRG